MDKHTDSDLSLDFETEMRIGFALATVEVDI